jgi:hypothetical protein
VSYAGAVSSCEWQELVARLTPACLNAGFDLVHPFPVAVYNEQASEEERLPELGRTDALGLLFGNTRHLWPIFLRAHDASPALQAAAHPLDAYVTQTLPRLLANATPQPAQLVYSHVTTPRAFPMQRLAERAAFAALSPSHLAVHPQHGPWFSLRAVAVVDIAGPRQVGELAQPCVGCSAPCVPALAHAIELSGPRLDTRSIAAQADAWIAVRDACPVGKASRYGEAQLAYHYRKDRSRLQLDR